MVEVGDVFETTIPESPWQRVFHTVATDELYYTDGKVVRSILRRCLRRSLELEDIRTITCSALGTGYGDLDVSIFATIADEVCREFEHTRLSRFAIVSYDSAEFNEICEATLSLGNWIPQKGD